MNDQTILDVFGKLLIEQARDQAVIRYDHIISGHLKGLYAEEVREKLKHFDPQELQIFQELLPDVVDTAIAAVLRMVDQEWIDVSLDTGSEVIPSIREVSDGVEGDFYGWVSKFSQQRFRPDE